MAATGSMINLLTAIALAGILIWAGKRQALRQSAYIRTVVLVSSSMAMLLIMAAIIGAIGL